MDTLSMFAEVAEQAWFDSNRWRDYLLEIHLGPDVCQLVLARKQGDADSALAQLSAAIRARADVVVVPYTRNEPGIGLCPRLNPQIALDITPEQLGQALLQDALEPAFDFMLAEVGQALAEYFA